jgi:ATP-binding cassette subfamily B protein/subfamily B ATP-binding cassette protein MsbA
MAEIVLRILTPWPMQAMVDYALGSKTVPSWLNIHNKERLLIAVVLTGLLIQVAHQVVMMLHTRLQASTSQHMIRDLRNDMFAHLQGLSLTQHARMPKGDSVYRLEADAPCLDHLVFGGLFPLTFSAITLVVMFSILLKINSTLAVISMAVAPPIYVWLRIHTRRIVPRLDRTKKLESKLNERLYESFSAIRLVKAFVREPFEQKRFKGAAQRAMEANIDLGHLESIFSVTIAIVTVLGNALVLVIGGTAVVRGNITLGTLLVVIAYLAYVYGPLSAVAQTTGNLQRALASARRVREIMTLMPESAEPDGAIEKQSLAGEVRFESVSFQYETGRTVLNNIGFSTNPGETIALVGPSGAGKTTLISLIPRFYELTSGRILIDGSDVRDFARHSLREHIAVVLQDAVIMAGTIRENIRYGRLDASDEEIYEAASAANAHEFISRLPKGYDTELGEGGSGLSGGQKQRLSIARAFLKNAPILVLDEPTAALDTISEVLVLDALKRLRGGRTTFVIAHRLSTIRDADRILAMDQGSIVAQGTHQELLETSSLYQQLCQQLHETEAEEILEAAELTQGF